jgi:tetratricopeptide (TPR) repeat protein
MESDPMAKNKRDSFEKDVASTTSVAESAIDPALAVAGERIRRFALGMVAILISVRGYWPSEDVESGSGLTWVFAVLVVLAIAVVGWIVGGTPRPRISSTDFAVIALFALVGVSTRYGVNYRSALNAAWSWTSIGIVYLLLRNLPRTRWESKSLVAALVASAIAASTYGLYQVAVEYPQMRIFYERHKQRILTELEIIPGTTSQSLYENRLYSNEPMSTFALTNSLAGYIVGPTIICLAVVGFSLIGREKRGRRSSLIGDLAAGFVPLFALIACLLLTKSRSAWAGAAISVVFLAFRLGPRLSRKTLAIAFAALAFGIASLVVAGVATRQLDRQILTESTKSLRYRMEYWTGAWRLIRQNATTFWHGVGPGNFAEPYLEHKIETSSEEIKDPHDMFLEVWACSGLPAAIALLIALGLGLSATAFGGDRSPGIESRSEEESNKDSRSDKLNGVDFVPETVVDPLDVIAPPPRSARWLIVTAAFGWLAVVAAGWVDPIANASRWYLLGVGWVGAVVLGRGIWRRVDSLAPGLGLGALAIAINLLAAGGIGMPAVALMLWSLIALGQNLRVGSSIARTRIPRGGRSFAFIVGVPTAMLIGLFVGTIVPFWKSESAVAEARALLDRRDPDFDRARILYLYAIDADRYNVNPWTGLADLEFRYWLSRGAKADEPIWSEVDIALKKAVEFPPRNPRDLAVQERRAAYAREILARHTGDFTPAEIIKLRGVIVNAARMASRINPTKAKIQADLAIASADLGEYSGAVKAAKEALRLDKTTPHLDRKLPGEVRDSLVSMIPEWEKKAREYERVETGSQSKGAPKRSPAAPGRDDRSRSRPADVPVKK